MGNFYQKPREVISSLRIRILRKSTAVGKILTGLAIEEKLG